MRQAPTTEIYTGTHTLSLHDALPISLTFGGAALGQQASDPDAGTQ